MPVHDSDAFDILIRKLQILATLDDVDRAIIRTWPTRTVSEQAGRFLVREGQATIECCLLMSGYACRHKMTHDGGRQIVSFHNPGDMLDLQHLLLDRADHNIQTITAATIAWIPTDAIRATIETRPAIARALWRDTLIDASIFREWVLNVGRRDAKSRVAHMLCEFAVRRELAGLGGPEVFELPMSQEQIGDATGLTPVHVNRMLQLLGSEGIIERNRRRIAITDWDRLRSVAEFDAAYLHAA